MEAFSVLDLISEQRQATSTIDYDAPREEYDDSTGDVFGLKEGHKKKPVVKGRAPVKEKGKKGNVAKKATSLFDDEEEGGEDFFENLASIPSDFSTIPYLSLCTPSSSLHPLPFLSLLLSRSPPFSSCIKSFL